MVCSSGSPSITQGIAMAATGDTIIAGPGMYGDLNADGILGNSPGEEVPSAGCGCMLSVNRVTAQPGRPSMRALFR